MRWTERWRTLPRVDRADVLASAALVALKCLVGAAVLAFGFTHVSDDDYARVTLAQRFVAAPHLDPSGTSWLPLPFWLAGSAMMLTGRSLAAARAVAFAIGALSPLPAYAMLRGAGVARLGAFAAIAVALASPWSAWSAATTVPDGWTGALVAAAAFSLMDARRVAWGALFASLAALSRYEAWPVCAVVAARAAFGQMNNRSADSSDPGALRASLGRQATLRRVGIAALAVAAPLAWLAWNRYAHGDALHFVARVAQFRAKNGAADASLSEKLLEYPRALRDDAPETLLFGLAALVAIALSTRRPAWRWPLVVAAASFAFLIYGDVRDGAPTHHPARALIGVSWIFTAWGMDHLSIFASRRSRAPFAPAVAIATATACSYVLFVLRYRTPPGTGEADRSAAIALGLSLRGERIAVTPCAYEHFALLAAFEAPENASIDPPVPLVPGEKDICPRVHDAR